MYSSTTPPACILHFNPIVNVAAFLQCLLPKPNQRLNFHHDSELQIIFFRILRCHVSRSLQTAMKTNVGQNGNVNLPLSVEVLGCDIKPLQLQFPVVVDFCKKKAAYYVPALLNRKNP